MDIDIEPIAHSVPHDFQSNLMRKYPSFEYPAELGEEPEATHKSYPYAFCPGTPHPTPILVPQRYPCPGLRGARGSAACVGGRGASLVLAIIGFGSGFLVLKCRAALSGP